MLSRVPYPLEKGDKLRAFYQIKELATYHDLYVCALSDQPLHPEAEKNLLPFVKQLKIIRFTKTDIAARLLRNIISGKPFQVAYFYSKSVHKQIKEIIEQIEPHHIFCQLIRTAEFVKDQAVDKTLDYQDAFSKGLHRRLRISPWYIRPFIKVEYDRVRQYEHEVFEAFEKKTIISSPDRSFIPHPANQSIHIIPNGVDTEFFQPMKVDKDFEVIFCGNMGYAPNISGAMYLVNDIMPLVWQERPGAKVVIAGANPSLKVRSLASENVIITGWVNDIRPWYARARVFVAPMQIGTGLQNKVLEAMAMQLPVVTSPLANTSLGANPNTELLIGNNPMDYAQHILTLLNDSEFYNKLNFSGFNFVSNHFRWKATVELLEQVITA